jgi:hypothetical protein
VAVLVTFASSTEENERRRRERGTKWGQTEKKGEERGKKSTKR